MNTEHIDPMDNRELTREDGEFLRLVHLVLGEHRCRECGAEIIYHSLKATLCDGCLDDYKKAYHRKYEKAAWQKRKAEVAASLDGAAA